MSNFLQQVPTLAGVILGALATILATTYAERSQWRRRQAVRWDDKRLEAYAQYAETLRHLHFVAMRMSASSRPGARSQPLDRAIGEELITEGEAARGRAMESVLMLGDAEVVSAARQWRRAVLALELFARGLLEDPAPWADLNAEADRARDQYYQATRRSLGVLNPSGT